MPSISNIVTPVNPPGSFLANIPNVSRWDFTASQILTLSSAPIIILPALPGYFYYPFLGIFYKNNGPVFTTAVQNILLQWNSSSPTNAMAWTAVGTVDQAIGTRFQMPAVVGFVDEAAASLGGKSVRLTASFDLGGTGSTCSILVAYYVLPVLSTLIPTI